MVVCVLTALGRSVDSDVYVYRYPCEHSMVVPTRPVVTFGRTVCFKNKEPMEVGLRYGWRFWENME